jgi:stage IV sporulation protein FB
MSWQERDYSDDRDKLGRPGGDWRGLRPDFDNPMSWSLPFFQIARITVRVHIIFLLFIVIELVQSMTGPGVNQGVTGAVSLTAIWIGALFLMVLLHEFGHCIACRWSGGDANEILMWPLGGLAYCMPPHRWQAHMITVIGGPLVNVIFFVAMAPLLALAAKRWWDVAVFNPLDPFAGFIYVDHSWLLIVLYALNHANLMLLAFNVLLPLFPFDGGRILQAAMWSRMGYSRSMHIAVRVGYIGAIVMFVAGMILRDGWLIGIAIFGGLTCYATYKQLQWTDSELGIETDEYALSVHGGVEADQPRQPTRRERRADRQALREQQEAEEVDRILQKIADSGMESLSRAERSLLKRVTERKRGKAGL